MKAYKRKWDMSLQAFELFYSLLPFHNNMMTEASFTKLKIAWNPNLAKDEKSSRTATKRAIGIIIECCKNLWLKKVRLQKQ